MKILLLIPLLFLGCVDSGEEEREPLTIFEVSEKNSSSTESVEPVTKVEEKKTAEDATEKKKTPKLILNSSPLVKLKVGESKKISFLLQNYDEKTELESEAPENILLSPISCSTSLIVPNTKICSTSISAESGGDGDVSIYIKGKPNISISIAVAIEIGEVETPEKEEKPKIEVVEKPKEEKLILNSSPLVKLKTGESKKISFILQNYNEKTELESEAPENISLSPISCSVSSIVPNTKICSTSISAESGGDGDVSIYVKGKPNISISIAVAVEIGEMNTSEKEEQPKKKGEFSFSFAEGQQDTITINSGETFLITTVVTAPRGEEKIITSTQGDGVSHIVKTYKDEKLSSEDRYIFRTEVKTYNFGEDRITLKLADSNLSLVLTLKVISYKCKYDEDEYLTITSGEVRDEIMVGAKLGFNSVKLIYPKLRSYSKIENQNFTYILDTGTGRTAHSHSANGAFAFMKFSLDLVGEEYKIHYKRDGSPILHCLDGVFPEPDLITNEVEPEENITEEAPPPSPQNN